MHPLQQEQLDKVNDRIDKLELERKQLINTLSDAIRTGEQFSTIFGLALDYGLNRFNDGYAKAELVHTKYPLSYEN